jgi:putative hydrolase of the HAD superfamily
VSIRAVVFDIGGVLEDTPRTGWELRWVQQLGLTPAAFQERLDGIWGPGSIGAVSLQEVHRRIGDEFGLADADVASLMDDVWEEYVGTLNDELAAYFAGLRPRFRTGILSNSFVGAREREQALYGAGDRRPQRAVGLTVLRR